MKTYYFHAMRIDAKNKKEAVRIYKEEHLRVFMHYPYVSDSTLYRMAIEREYGSKL